jgi:5-methylcytosine-specific restriction endonuclease McrA
MPVEQALDEKTTELRFRLFLLCIPDRRLRPEQVPDYLGQVLNHEPSGELVAQVIQARRTVRLTDAELLELEARQASRCALCGILLEARAQPHVDHIIPVALGGKSELDNYQILCRKCNQGKSALLGWVLAGPFLREGVSLTLRYCVLARAQGKCEEPGCCRHARDSHLAVALHIPRAKGGRAIFDNLEALCQEHLKRRHARSLAKARAALTAARRRTLLGLPWRPE